MPARAPHPSQGRLAASRLAALLLLALLLLAPGRAMAQAGPMAPASLRFVTLAGIGTARLIEPEPARQGGALVVVLPDASGGDPRSGRYSEHLAALGIATLEPQWQEASLEEQARLAQALLHELHAIASSLGVAAGRVALLGFGAGAQRAIEAGPPAPLAALYPGCGALLAGRRSPTWSQPPAPAARPLLAMRDATGPGIPPPVLLLHGSADEGGAGGACAALVAALGPLAARHEYFGASFAWDYEPGPWYNAASLLPAPEGGGARRLAHATPEVAEDAAGRVAAVLAALLQAPVPLLPMPLLPTGADAH